MEIIDLGLSPAQWAFCLGLAVAAGVVKGVVGFAMPTILISGLGAVLSPQVALAGLILPTLVTNVVQALRDGPVEAMRALPPFRWFLISAALALVLAAQLYALLPQWVLFAVIGLPVMLFSVTQLAGRSWILTRASRRSEVTMGTLTGVLGGLSGIWAPPTVAYLTALQLEKSMQMRLQGVIFGLGSLLLLAAHGPSGVVRAETLVFSALLVPPALVGMSIGQRIQDRINQITFRRITLWVLFLAGLNLLRRALIAV
ncbi:TSUP family transporter [Roseobacteraceae bacterium S113]